MYSSQARPLSSTAPSVGALRLPQLPHSLSNTNIVGLKRVQRNAQQDGCCTERPVGSGANLGHSVLGEVVDDARLETDVRVDNEQGAEDRVGDGVKRAGGERCNCEGDQTSGDDSGLLLALWGIIMSCCSLLLC
jgi:hypothetical protein